MSPYLLLFFLWVAYYFLHSLFARPWFKERFAHRLPWLMPHYRLLYSIGAAAGLVGILFYNALISHERLLPPGGLARYLGLMLTTAGVLVIRQAFRVYSFQEFVGLKPQNEGKALGNNLRTEGILGRVRHPLYAGTLLLVLGFWLYIPTLANLITAVVAIMYLFIGIGLEERDLERQFGEAYREYRRQVPMLIPRFGRRG